MRTTRTKGFSVIEVSLIVAVIAVIGGLGFVFYNKWQASQQTQASTPPATTKSTAQTLTKTADLDKVSSTLDATDVTSASDATALNSNLSF